jgi:hypothetical protein
VAFSYLDRLLQAPNIPVTVARFREVLASKEFGLTVAFQDEIHKEFSEQLYTLMQLIEDFGIALTTEDLLDKLLEGMQRSLRLYYPNKSSSLRLRLVLLSAPCSTIVSIASSALTDLFAVGRNPH